MIEIFILLFIPLFLWMNLYQMVHVQLLQMRIDKQKFIFNFWNLLFFICAAG